MERKSKKQGIYVYKQLIHFAVQQKLTLSSNCTPIFFFLSLLVCNLGPDRIGPKSTVSDPMAWLTDYYL